jgi:hypothetical protein
VDGYPGPYNMVSAEKIESPSSRNSIIEDIKFRKAFRMEMGSRNHTSRVCSSGKEHQKSQMVYRGAALKW